MKSPETWSTRVFKKIARLGFVQVVEDYHGPNASYYDAIQSRFLDDIPFYLHAIGTTPCRILELGCGTGRITFPLAKAGHIVYALDNSEDMLSILVAKRPPTLSNQVIPVLAEFTEFAFDIQFDYIILGLNAVFHLLDLESRVACFSLVNKHLNTDGGFLIDFKIPTVSEMAEPNGRYTVELLEDGGEGKCIFIMHNAFDSENRTARLNFLYIDIAHNKKPQLTITHATEYHPSVSEMKWLINKTGFQIASMWCDYVGTRYDEAEEKKDVIILAKKLSG